MALFNSQTRECSHYIRVDGAQRFILLRDGSGDVDLRNIREQ
ncbi:hypothetical protein [Bowmanella denitrificans]|nr:hypothetical protein [Bowmanella denitrificans]